MDNKTPEQEVAEILSVVEKLGESIDRLVDSNVYLRQKLKFWRLLAILDSVAFPILFVICIMANRTGG